jgi:glutathione S-transferase
LKVRHELVEIDLKDKAPSFTEAYRKAMGSDPSSDGKVPLIEDDGVGIAESDVVSYYLNDKFATAETSLFPSDPKLAAAVRLWVNTVPGKVIGNWYGMIYSGEAEVIAEKKAGFDAALDAMTEQFKTIEALLPEGSKGDFVCGSQLTFADIMAYPWFARIAVLKARRGYEIDAKYERVLAWCAACAAHPAVAATTEPVEYYVEKYSKYGALP